MLDATANAAYAPSCYCGLPASTWFAGVHVDRGSQYTSGAFTNLLDRTQAIASLSRPGNPYDNVLAESGWSTLKTELLPRGACFANP